MKTVQCFPVSLQLFFPKSCFHILPDELPVSTSCIAFPAVTRTAVTVSFIVFLSAMVCKAQQEMKEIENGTA